MNTQTDNTSSGLLGLLGNGNVNANVNVSMDYNNMAILMAGIFLAVLLAVIISKQF